MVDLPTQVMISDQMYGVKGKPYSGRVYACMMCFVFVQIIIVLCMWSHE